MSNQLHRYPNLFNREFTATRPNEKWATDISYISTKLGTLHLSVIRDLFDNSIVAYKTGTKQSINLMLQTVRMAQEKEAVAAELQLHSDQGFQYASQAYFALTRNYGITPSISRRGNCYDNAMAENFFGILKAECLRRHKPQSIAHAKQLIDNFIYFYNHERIQLKTRTDAARKTSSVLVILSIPAIGAFICVCSMGFRSDLAEIPFCKKQRVKQLIPQMISAEFVQELKTERPHQALYRRSAKPDF